MSPILDVLIGMIFIFSLLSILVTQINAVITNTMKLRAKHLREGLHHLVKDDEILAKVITHPLIDMAEKAPMILPEQRLNEQQVHAIVKGALNNVTWIAPEDFTNVLLNIIRVNSDQELFGALLNVVDEMPAGETRRRLRLLVNKITSTGEGIQELHTFINSLEDPAYKKGLTELLHEIDEEVADLGLEPDSNIAVMAGLRKVKNPYLRNALSTILASSKSIEEAEIKIGQWFNNGMDRSSTAFKNVMQWFSLGIGLVIAIVLNVDSLYVAQRLWNDPTLRNTVAIAAQQVDIADLQAQANAAQSSFEAASNTDTTSPEATATADLTIEELTASLVAAGATAEQFSNLRLPLGWNFESLDNADPETDARVGNSRYVWNFVPWNYNGWFVLWLSKIIGLGATMIAIAQGAPFWFGLLQRLSSGKG